MSADVYSDLTIGLTLKNYPKMTHHMLKSAHWFQSYDVVSPFILQSFNISSMWRNLDAKGFTVRCTHVHVIWLLMLVGIMGLS